MSQNKFKTNLADRPGIDICNNEGIKQLWEVCCKDIFSTFSAINITFNIYMLQRLTITTDSKDPNNLEAVINGYTVLNTLAAVSCIDKRVYAIWEFYSNGDAGPFLGKGIEVDEKHQRMGIGKAFCRAVKEAGYDIKPSGYQTAAGAALLNSVSAP